jgi:hypothetical protein
MQERAAEVNRLQKTLEGANIKAAVATRQVWASDSGGRWWPLVAGGTAAAAPAQSAKGHAMWHSLTSWMSSLHR